MGAWQKTVHGAGVKAEIPILSFAVPIYKLVFAMNKTFFSYNVMTSLKS